MKQQMEERVTLDTDMDIETPGVEGAMSARTMQEVEEASAEAPAPPSPPAPPAPPSAPSQREPRPERDGANGGVSTDVSMKSLLEAGVHFGHQTKRWNPKMKPY